MDMTRRSVFGFVPGFGAMVLGAGKLPLEAAPVAVAVKSSAVTTFSWAKLEMFRRGVIGEVGEDAFDAWFRSIEWESLESGKLTVSVPVPFLKRWIDAHYDRPLLRGAQRAEPSVESVEVVLRKPGYAKPVVGVISG